MSCLACAQKLVGSLLSVPHKIKAENECKVYLQACARRSTGVQRQAVTWQSHGWRRGPHAPCWRRTAGDRRRSAWVASTCPYAPRCQRSCRSATTGISRSSCSQRNVSKQWLSGTQRVCVSQLPLQLYYKKTVLSQGNRAMPQLFVAVAILR